MKLIIAEKPSLARSIVNAIGGSSFTRKSVKSNFNGYFEGTEYIVTWAFGHLFGLIDLEAYLDDPPEEPRWTFDNLPFCPDEFKFALKKDAKGKVDPAIKTQYKVIEDLIKDKRITEIVHAGDSDREGEVIVRLILENIGTKKPVSRLWLPSQDAQSIRDSLKDLKPDNEYDNLAAEGFARTYVDWLYGVNLTRYSSLKARKLLRVGRVIVPIVRAIYDREMEIKNFKAEKYFAIVSNEETSGEEIKLQSKHTFKTESEAYALANEYNKEKATVSAFDTEEKTIGAGRLYSLSKLQGVLGRRFKMPPKESLSIIQKLYEEGYVTYPRTNTEYLATGEKGKVASIIKKLSDEGYPVMLKHSKSIFDDTKIESHSALTPTSKFPTSLSEKEQKVYDTIKNRFIAVFCSELFTVDRTTIKIDVGGKEEFTLTGDVIKSEGWTKYDENDKKERVLPKLKVGDEVNINFMPEEKYTNPPKRYTTATFMTFLENPFRSELKSEEYDDEDYKNILAGLELGTPATRTGIIDNAIKQGYISLKSNTYYLEEAGKEYIEIIDKLGITIDKFKTAEIGKKLKDIYHEDLKTEELIDFSFKEIEGMMSLKDSVSIESENAVLGKCPICGKDVIKASWGIRCEDYKKGCNFALGNTVAGKKLTDRTFVEILSTGKSKRISGFKSKTGNKFDAALKLVDKTYEGNAIKGLEFVFEQYEAKELTSKCPKCSGTIKNGKYGWYCPDCSFKISREICSKKLTEGQVEDLIEKGRTSLIKGFTSKNGKKFNAHLMLDDEGNVKFDFD